MWNPFSMQLGSADQQRVDLNHMMMAQQPGQTALNPFLYIPAYVGQCADGVGLNTPVIPPTPPESRPQHPYAIALLRHALARQRSRPSTPTPLSLEHSIPPMLGANILTATHEKCYNPNDPTIRIVDKEDELDFLCEGFKSPRALMSCGHAVTPSSLTNWCHRLLDEGKTRFVCGQSGCNAEWSYKEVCKMALLTPREQRHFEETMSSNAAKCNTKPCPVCKSPVLRSDQSNLRVHCVVCTATTRRIYEFCWQCLREWRGPASQSDHCDNEGCSNESLKTLQMCTDITLNSVKFPSIRACPTCGILLQHDKKGCKNASCPRCKKYFCFVCLKVGYHALCSGAAPRQTSIPVWKKN